MDHFPATDFFEELRDFTNGDFEEVWDISNELNSLSDEEKALFPDTAAINMDNMNNPMLSSVIMDDNDLFMEDGNQKLSDEMDMLNQLLEDTRDNDIPDIDLPIKEEVDDTVMPSPARNYAEEIKAIHSYCQPEPIIEEPPKTEVKKQPKVNVLKENKSSLNQVQSGRVMKRTRRPVKRFEDSSDDSESDAEHAPASKSTRKSKKSKTVSISKSSSNSRRVKLYEMRPFSDPEKERCRINAINAKINRDRKKNERNNISQEMSNLRQENKQLKSKNRKYKQRLSSFEARLESLEAIIRANNIDLKSGNDSNSSHILKDFNLSAYSSSNEETDDNDVIIY